MSSANTTTIEPFSVDIPDADVADLRHRLHHALVPDELVEDQRWSHGIARQALVPMLDRWRSGEFDWRAHERRINALPHFRARVRDGRTRVHFVHLRSISEHDAVPLLLLHGWPGCFFEFQRVVEPLARPSDPRHPSFHVVVPSLPGFGFSDPVRDVPVGRYVEAIADALVEVMDVLGYDRFLVQGGDIGSVIARTIALRHPSRCLAIHLNFALAPVPSALSYLPQRLLLNVAPSAVLTADEMRRLARPEVWEQRETGYSRIQGTKPYTLAVGLHDSPVGLLAWIGEKLRVFSPRKEDQLPVDDVLTIISIYWFTRTIGSSFRFYKDNPDGIKARFSERYVAVPTGIARYPGEIYAPPRRWLQYNHNLVYYSEIAKGGHFAALEQPELFINDIRSFARSTRSAKL